MNSKYQEWIDNLTAEEKNGNCDKVTSRMKEDFPELKRVRGHVELTFCPEDPPHWWMKTDDGEIVDPTISQFSDPSYIYGGICRVMRYIEWEELREEPYGK